MPAEGKTNASQIKSGDRVMVRRTEIAEAVIASWTKAKDAVILNVVRKEETTWGPRARRAWDIHGILESGESVHVVASGNQTFWLAP